MNEAEGQFCVGTMDPSEALPEPPRITRRSTCITLNLEKQHICIRCLNELDRTTKRCPREFGNQPLREKCNG